MRLTREKLIELVKEAMTSEGPVGDAIKKRMMGDIKDEVPEQEQVIKNMLSDLNTSIMAAANKDIAEAKKLKDYLMIALEKWEPK